MFKVFKNKISQLYLRYKLSKRNVIIRNGTVIHSVNFLGSAIIESDNRLHGDSNIIIGDNFYLNVGCHFLGNITIGDDVLIGPKTIIWGRDHGISKDELIRKQQHIKAPIIIGNNVWIGANVTILKGVKIGDGAVIGAGAIVTKDIPEYSIAVGNPAKVVRFRK